MRVLAPSAMRYRVTVDATIEAPSNRDALRLVGEKVLASAAEEREPWSPGQGLDELQPLNYWFQVVPEED